MKGKLEVEFTDFAIAAILFEPVFVESLHYGSEKNLETRTAVECIAKRKNDLPVDVADLAGELGISKDRAYGRLRNAEKAGLIHRVNKPVKSNHKLFLPTPRPHFIPDPEDVFRDVLELGKEARFVHPLTGKRVTYRRTGRGKSG